MLLASSFCWSAEGIGVVDDAEGGFEVAFMWLRDCCGALLGGICLGLNGVLLAVLLWNTSELVMEEVLAAVVDVDCGGA